MDRPDDLSAYHEPLTRLFPTPDGDDERFRLDDEALRCWQESGYVAGVRVLEEAQVEALLRELEPLFDPAHPGNGLFHEFHANESGHPERILFHALGAWRISPAFHDALWNPAFTVPARQLLGGAVRFWHDQLFCKPAHHGGFVAWHQDYSYWTRTQPMQHLSSWIALDPSDLENGCLQYVPGSHRWNLLPITGLAGDMRAIESVLTPEQREDFRPVPIELKPGEAAFHHPLLVHGSLASRSARPRRAYVLNACRDGVRCGTGEPLLDGVPVLPEGSPLQGRFFPLLT